jgi:hypothetical protein
MTLKELKERVDYEMRDERNGYIEVRIPNHKKGMMGGTPATVVKYAHRGIDWDHGVFFIVPEVYMIENNNGK